jgi:hypothetical protein
MKTLNLIIYLFISPWFILRYCWYLDYIAVALTKYEVHLFDGGGGGGVDGNTVSVTRMLSKGRGEPPENLLLTNLYLSHLRIFLLSS